MRKTFQLISLPLLLLVASAHMPSANPVPADPERYCNNRYDFCITYPGEVFTERESSPNNDGIHLFSADKDVEMRVNGYYNVMGWTLQDEVNEILEMIKTESTDKVVNTNSDFNGNEAIVRIEMRVVTTYVQLIQIGDHFVSMIIVTNRLGKSIASHQINDLLSKINLEVKGI